MKIGIIGTGRIGTATGKRWAKAGHDVLFGSRDAGKAAGVAQETGHGARGGSYAEAVQFAEVLLLATPFRVTQQVIESLPPLDGKIIIETTNNMGGGDDESTSEQVARWAKGAHVVKAFNTIFYNLIEGEPTAIRPAVFLAGDDAAAKRTVAALVTDAGFDPVDSGSLEDAHHLDALAKFIIHLGGAQGMGRKTSYLIAQIE